MHCSDVKAQDRKFMQRALKLAQLGQTHTSPNPMVGCVIVKDGVPIAEAYHRCAGEYHAERAALSALSGEARGATVYVNLEPCGHQGRTPPCVDALIDAGVARVVVAMQDPNPLVQGSGFALLREAGIEVEVGVCEQEAKWLNRGFISRMRAARPWVTLKTAATLDGRTADAKGESQWISGEKSRQDVQKQRANSCAIITGIDTVLMDNPRLTARYKSDYCASIRQPRRVVLDSHLRLPLDANIIANDNRVLLFTVSKNQEKICALQARGVEVVSLSANADDRLDLELVLAHLAKWECNQVLIEAGKTLSGQFLQAGLVDALLLYYAPTILGSEAKGMFDFGSALDFSQRIHFNLESVHRLDSDIRLNLIQQARRAAILDS